VAGQFVDAGIYDCHAQQIDFHQALIFPKVFQANVNRAPADSRRR
jgi:hypothetical protein